MDNQYLFVNIDNIPAEIVLQVGQLLVLYRYMKAGAPRLCNLNVPSQNFQVRQPRFGESLPGQPEQTFIVALNEAVAPGSGTMSVQFAPPELYSEPTSPKVVQYLVN